MKGRLRELVSMIDASKSQRPNPSGRAAPEQALYDVIAEANPALRLAFDTIRRFSISRVPVLITGESGTANELAARAIHYGSPSKSGPFIAISCASMPVTAIGPELFGSERSLSGRTVRKIGHIEMADGGTLFFDAVNNLPLEGQARLLRFLQEGTIERIGSRRPIPIAARIIVATRVDLRKAVANRQFRGDLLHHLDTLTLKLPPLHDEGHDILLMAKFFVQQCEERAERKKEVASVETTSDIPSHTWPEDLRELIAGIETVAFRDRVSLRGRPLEPVSPAQQTSPPGSRGLAGTRATVEAALVRATLKRNRCNIKQSAKEMGISRVTLYRAIHKYGIVLDRSRARVMVSDVRNVCHPYPLSALVPTAHSGR